MLAPINRLSPVLMVVISYAVAFLVVASISSYAAAFQSPITHGIHRQATNLFSSVPERDTEDSTAKPPLSSLVNRVAVAGATGRTGKLVVQLLLEQNVQVFAMVRDEDKAKNTLDPTNDMLTIKTVDLGSEDEVKSAIKDNKCDAAIWAATGFSDAPDQSFVTKVKAIFGYATNAQGSIDAVGLPALGEALSKSSKRTLTKGADNSAGNVLPKVVMLSSAGVTRPDWSDEKKLALEGAAGIPIVRLNPFGILGVKKESEDKLRNCGVDYTIFRPCGLNDKWSAGQRPIFSQGDIAVGRINRQDVATILVDLLSTPEATGKTFETVTVANSEGYYPPNAQGIGAAIGRLQLDSENGGTGPSEDVVRATYALMQQLIPGEKQEPQSLAWVKHMNSLTRKRKEDLASEVQKLHQ